MLQGLKQRFEYATDPSTAKFDPLFVTATFLNPPYQEILTDTQIKVAKNIYLSYVNHLNLMQIYRTMIVPMSQMLT